MREIKGPKNEDLLLAKVQKISAGSGRLSVKLTRKRRKVKNVIILGSEREIEEQDTDLRLRDEGRGSRGNNQRGEGLKLF